MKIYTEIQYEWVDGELKEVSSESFDYEGEVTLCGGGGWSPPKINPKFNPATALGKITPDMTGLGDVMPNFTDSTQQALGSVTGGINQGMGQVAGGLGNLGGQFQTGLNTTVGQTGNWFGEKVMPVGMDAINIAGGFADQLGRKLTEFIHGPQKQAEVKLSKQSMKGGLKGKKASELGANKAKKRARGSLRIKKSY